MNKVVRDGKVAVLYSPGFGAGWFTWNSTIVDNAERMIFDPIIVQILETNSDNAYQQIIEYVGEEYPDAYDGGVEDLTIAWIPVGTKFYIDEYDGSESIKTVDDTLWMTA
jgi:hypothetical protein